MEIGWIGLGRMGLGMVRRLRRAGLRVVGYDRDPERLQGAAGVGAERAGSLEELVGLLAPPRVVWLMIPAGKPVDETLAHLLPHLTAGDVLVDGGNSYYRDTLRRAEQLRGQGVHLVDVGTSGGMWGAEEGYCLMVGGDAAVVERLRPVFEALAPAPDRGWGHLGPVGAGHFVKMVHNSIEYGLMQAYAEGFSLLRRKQEFGLDVRRVAEVWRYGSVIRSWLLDLLSRALAEDPDLSRVLPYVEDTGEGRWTVFEAVELDVPAPVITLSLIQRLRSRDRESYGDRLLAVLRQQFGGHPVQREP
ncbi:MAG: decarboxylating 6-phosphogluconate dehydrogenase [Armatimonadota bacterium]|nr:decarboxylating 6-phosphogluconate dehydrogenase [Armatimonadota bacterium]MDR7563978.1 decarboxylating 6-phosphogluconate dehydrogenase [Armatimonadota bacterium]MDR7568725.1 decarboxylating 6-phosphogluconate dehydrogenase [Armatimonadota bacterium]MDR7602957.1 decarboxylating 6-phosphogluconate dehydrogenase [Armatimonadota bacterium]